MIILVPAAVGVEAVVKRQLQTLGYPDTRAVDGRVVVENCSWTDVARMNVFLRSGERVLIKLAQFEAVTFDQLFDGIVSVPWCDFVDKHGRVTVVTKSVGSALFAHHSIQSVGKKAIVSVLQRRYGALDETGAEYKVELDITRDVVSVNLDTTGVGLHKRGYRTLPYDAPLKETTAAALIDLSVWNPDKTFTDLFCGSGTLPIEAAMKALKIAPGLNRKFAFQNWACVDASAHDLAVSEARDLRVDRPLKIIGADVSEKAVDIAKFHAKQAGVDKYVKFNVRAAQDFVTKQSYGVNISNPPYGERLGDLSEARKIAREMGALYRTLDKWNFYFLSPEQQWEKLFGRRADKKRYLYNAGIKCTYYTFNGPKPV
ncbi:MAG: class I SAM-dependent RNA methyltransferase [Corallococcus sp.]|nr:class I SAM-dependent RNA methyltransferase [Corallococcus sp.]MCM1359037.1 class I SAM-dependent RNA methyltransferase [Corallococcus sp.]MCM1395026.1 class I SAM-dependent RNA methyltransferase [Corallococcus sp.]